MGLAENAALILGAAAAMAAGLMRGFAGFGSGMLMAPIFAILFGPIEAVAMVTLLELFASLQLLPQTLKDTEWGFVGPLGLSAAVTMPLGALLLRSADPLALTRAMAAIVLVFGIVLMTGWRHGGEKKLLPALSVGAVSGALMAATSMGNPPVLLYMLAGRDSAAKNRANIIAYFAVTQAVLVPVLALMSVFPVSAALRAVLLTPAYLVSTWAGSRLFRRSNEALYRRAAIAFLLAVGVYGLLR